MLCCIGIRTSKRFPFSSYTTRKIMLAKLLLLLLLPLPTAVPITVRGGSKLCAPFDQCQIGGPPCEAGTYCKEINPLYFQCTENNETRGVPSPFPPIYGSQVCYPTVNGAYVGPAEKVCNKLHARICKFIILLIQF